MCSIKVWRQQSGGKRDKRLTSYLSTCTRRPTIENSEEKKNLKTLGAMCLTIYCTCLMLCGDWRCDLDVSWLDKGKSFLFFFFSVYCVSGINKHVNNLCLTHPGPWVEFFLNCLFLISAKWGVNFKSANSENLWSHHTLSSVPWGFSEYNSQVLTNVWVKSQQRCVLIKSLSSAYIEVEVLSHACTDMWCSELDITFFMFHTLKYRFCWFLSLYVLD